MDEAKNQYQVEWPQEEEELDDDPTFQSLWDEIGGNKIDKKIEKKLPEKKNIKVEVPSQEVEEKKEVM